MSESGNQNFNTVIREMIKKSLFTERQVEIILSQRRLLESEFSITRGAYYRQVGQSKEKLEALFYTVVVLRSLGVLLPDDIDVMLDLSDRISVIKDSDMSLESADKMMDVIQAYIRQACNS